MCMYNYVTLPEKKLNVILAERKFTSVEMKALGSYILDNPKAQLLDLDSNSAPISSIFLLITIARVG